MNLGYLPNDKILWNGQNNIQEFNKDKKISSYCLSQMDSIQQSSQAIMIKPEFKQTTPRYISFQEGVKI